jgi:hypothetical protein
MKTIEKVIICIFFLMSAIGCTSESSNQTKKHEYIAVSEHTREIVLKNLRLALAPNRQAARIYFNGTCDRDDTGDLLFPIINIHAPVKQGRGLESVRDIFRNDLNVAVSETHSGIVKITIGKVSGAILDTKIPLLKLDQRAQYNPGGLEGAIPAIEDTSEFKAASKKLKTSQVSYFYIGGVVPALETLPHLPASITNVTVDEALDSVAKTFGGVVTYGECKKPNGENLIDIGFYYLSSDK